MRRVDEEPEGLREEISRVHAALPGNGTISLLIWPVARGCGLSSPRRPSSSSWRTRSWRLCLAAPWWTFGSKKRASTGKPGSDGRTPQEPDPGGLRPDPGVETYAILETRRREHLPGTSATHKRSPSAPAATFASERPTKL